MSDAPAVPPDLSAEDQALLAELDHLIESNPLVGYNNPELARMRFAWDPNFRLGRLHKKQLEFHAYEAPPLGTKLLLASNRSGKTVCGVVDNIIQLIPDELVPSHLSAFKRWHEPVTIWVGAPKNENHFNSTIPLFRQFLPQAALVEGKWGKSFKSQPNPRLILANGSEVAFKTYDQDLDAWAGAKVHRIHWDEEPNGSNSVDLRTEARYRLATTEGDELITMTPVLGAHSWVNDEVWAVRNDDPKVFAMKMKIWDNPWNSQETIAQLVKEAKARGEDVYRTRILAEFVHLGGLFFPEFSEERHVVDEIDPDHLKGQEIVVSIDPGKERSGVVWVAFDGENRALVFDEYFPADAEVAEVAAEIKERNRAWQIKEPDYVIDPSARNQNAINADQIEAAYQRAGIYAEWGQNSRPAGILEVRRRLGQQPNPGLLFACNCQLTIKQAETYARDPKAQDEWKAVPQTGRVRHDLIDAVRYAVMSRTYFDPDEEPYKAPAYQPNYQPPFREERFPEPNTPLGAFT